MKFFRVKKMELEKPLETSKTNKLRVEWDESTHDIIIQCRNSRVWVSDIELPNLIEMLVHLQKNTGKDL